MYPHAGLVYSQYLLMHTADVVLNPLYTLIVRGGARRKPLGVPTTICLSSLRNGRRRMEFEQLIDTAEEWCSGNPFELIAAECSDERRLDFYAEPRFSFYVLCPDANCDSDSFVSIKKPSVCMRPESVKVLRLLFSQCACVEARVGYEKRKEH